MLYAILKPKQKIKAKDVFDKEQLKDIKLEKGEKIYKLTISINDIRTAQKKNI